MSRILIPVLSMILGLTACATVRPQPTGELAAGVHDTHFHPCPFGDVEQCVKLWTIPGEMAKAGVEVAWVFGLQHRLVSRPGDFGTWPEKNSCELVEPMRFSDDIATCRRVHSRLIADGRLPFHYNDPCARPGWPVRINDRADRKIFDEYEMLDPATRQRIKPFVSYLDFDDPCGGSAEGVSRNLAYVRAMDRRYPRMVHGFAEHNLNKIVLYSHDACRPEVDDWLRCASDLMRYIAPSRRPFGVHFDLQDIDGRSFEGNLMKFARAYPQNVLVWLHGGIAPEVTDRLSARDHLEAMRRFLASSPGRRYVELSWTNGFFRRLNEQELRIDQRGWPIDREFEQELQLYGDFIAEHKDQLLFGSDQVSLHYPELVVEGIRLHSAYDDNYRKTLDEQRGLLRLVVSDDRPDAESIWQAIVTGNARRLMAAIVWPEGVPSEAASP